MPPPAGSPRLAPWEKLGLAGVGLFFVLFGVVVEVRSAFQQNRKTDFGVYARAAWAVREGHDPYAVADDNGWHYCYPPAFAALLAPLADPYYGEPRTGYLPFWASVALWYAFGLATLAFALDRFAAAVLPDEPRFSRRWWYARTIPLYAAFGGVGFTLGRGQVNVLVVALFAGMFAAAVAGRRFRAGAWLGAAVCVKVIPAYLGLWVLLRRDARMVAGAAAAAVVGFGLIPAAVWGPRGAVELNERMFLAVLAPGAGGVGDGTRAKELTNDTATDSQSFRSAIHVWLYPDEWTRPPVADRGTGLIHWGICAALTLLTVVSALRRPPTTPGDQLVLLGAFAALMLLVTPVSHMHYYAYGLPLACGLWLRGMAARPAGVSAGRGVAWALALWGVATALPLAPTEWAEFLRQRGFGAAATVGLWVVAVGPGLRVFTSPSRPAFTSPAVRVS